MLRRIGGFLLVAALCAGCSGKSESLVSADTSETTETAVETTTPPPPPPPEPDADGDRWPDSEDGYPNDPNYWNKEEIKVACDVKGGRTVFQIDRIKPNWRKVWATPLPERRTVIGLSVYCESPGYSVLQPVSGIEQTIVDASNERTDEYTIRIPYEQCVEHGTNATMFEWPRSQAQVKEAQTALLLCPGHPDAQAIRTRIADLGVLQQQLGQGRAFGDGNHRVGQGVQPGTYFVNDATDCYWERLDSAGNIIDNNFVLDAIRVEAVIGAGDFSFHTQGCGTWRPVG